MSEERPWENTAEVPQRFQAVSYTHLTLPTNGW